jgi:phosphoribosylglycinamide formyltransferase-1
MINIVIFASGEGSNAESIMKHFQGSSIARVTWIICNNESAGVVKRAEKFRKGIQFISKATMEKFSNQLTEFLLAEKTDIIVLAGFLLKIPTEIIAAFPNRIINLHPSLLPKFGGKGMYGVNVHKAVIAAQEKMSGITIHYVNENYDEGKIILQKSFELAETETTVSLAEKIQKLEHDNFSLIIEHST